MACWGHLQQAWVHRLICVQHTAFKWFATALMQLHHAATKACNDHSCLQYAKRPPSFGVARHMTHVITSYLRSFLRPPSPPLRDEGEVAVQLTGGLDSM
mmetsp:Transcript_66752/g.111856  ORF Transcript_66752/g.111856 Transcript_66752/m.111856 type:complete len:99 (+) Transcript_66752:143-439(+)